MAIQHKFQNHDWGNGFWTENSILKTQHYKPEVLIIGTFNPNWYCNPSDFFYGRGMYMWPIMANLFLHNQNNLTSVRNYNNDSPSLKEIFEICKKGKLCFADIVKGTASNIPTTDKDGIVLVNNEYYWSDYKDSHLSKMGAKNWLDDNTKDIIEYVKNTPSIKHIYFTFKTGGRWILNKKQFIIDNTNIPSSSLFTPTGTGFRKNLQAPFETRIKSLTHCWVWNGLQHNIPVNKPEYGNLNHNWLIQNGVDLEQF